MKAVSSAVMRDLDKRTSEDFNVPGEELMDRAGQGIADLVAHLVDRCGLTNPLIRLFAGRGNNGGDAFAAARVLREDGHDVEVWLAGSAGDVRGDALRHFSRMRAGGVKLRELPTPDDWDHALADADFSDIVVDGILGLGIQGPARGPAAGAIHCVNTLAEDSLVVAIDVPSGLNADTGEASGETVKADVTATIGLPKTGLLLPQAIEYVGNLEVVDIGIPWDLVRPLASELELISLWDLRGLFPRRPRAAHKGQYGHVLIIAGASGYAGAAIMAARAAGRSGAGLVSVLTPRSIAGVVAGATVETMVHAAAENSAGAIRADALAAWSERLGDFNAIVVGPGLTPGEDTLAALRTVLEHSRGPVVVDADALNVCRGRPEWLKATAGPLVLTPHPGELGRLLGVDAAAIQADRHGSARRAAESTGAVVVLKGAGTVVAQTGRPLGICMNGNPGMAAGGMGDVLAGVLGGLLAQGLKPFEAACAATFIHGRAGDFAAWHKSQAGIIASDVIEELPYALREVAMH